MRFGKTIASAAMILSFTSAEGASCNGSGAQVE
jgi:hypothetical protein